jgi:hypothetical protein
MRWANNQCTQRRPPRIGVNVHLVLPGPIKGCIHHGDLAPSMLMNARNPKGYGGYSPKRGANITK